MEPVNVNPPTVDTLGWFLSDEADFSSNPLALTHGEGVAHGLEFLPIGAIGECYFTCIDVELEVNLFMYGKLIGVVILSGLFKLSKYFDLFGSVLVSVFTSNLLQFEVVPYRFNHQSTIVQTHHDESAVLSVCLCDELKFGCCCEIISRGLL